MEHAETPTIGAADAAGQRLDALIRGTTDKFYRTDLQWMEIRQLAGQESGRPLLTREAWLDEQVHVDDRPRVVSAIERGCRSQEPFEVEHRNSASAGSPEWWLLRAFPIAAPDGGIAEWFAVATDVTARRRAIERLEQLTGRLEQQKRFYESLIASTPDLVYAFDLQYRLVFANRALLEMWDRSLEDSVGRRLVDLGYEPWHADMHEREIDRVAATGEAIRGEVGFPHAEQGWRVYDYIFTPVFDASGKVERIAGTTRDITEIREAQDRLKHVIDELNHRVMNMLATVQALAAQTFGNGRAEPHARKAFETRLMSLSSAHALVAGNGWKDVSLEAAVRAAVGPFHGSGASSERFAIRADEVRVPPQAALALAAGLHELAANAAQHGAWSGEAGVVAVEGFEDRGRIRVEWLEREGPPVRQPSRQGLGSRLVGEALARELGGAVTLTYDPAGVRCTIEFPIPSPGTS